MNPVLVGVLADTVVTHPFHGSVPLLAVGMLPVVSVVLSSYDNVLVPDISNETPSLQSLSVVEGATEGATAAVPSLAAAA